MQKLDDIRDEFKIFNTSDVYEWFMGNMEDKEEYQITYPSTEFELVMRRKK